MICSPIANDGLRLWDQFNREGFLHRVKGLPINMGGDWSIGFNTDRFTLIHLYLWDSIDGAIIKFREHLEDSESSNILEISHIEETIIQQCLGGELQPATHVPTIANT